MKTTTAPPTHPLAPHRESRCPITRAKRWMASLFARQSEPNAAGTSREELDEAPAAGACPLGFGRQQTESVFVDHAARESANEKVLPGDPEGDRLLAEAREAIYHWPENFPGFEAELELAESDQFARGRLVAGASRRYTITLDQPYPEKWLKFQIEELLAHREHPKVSRMKSSTGMKLGDDDAIYGRQLFFVGDKMRSYYRIKERRITQISRCYGGQRFVINIDLHQECDGRFAAQAYSAFYYDSESGQLTKTEAFLDHYEPVEGIYLPTERRFSEATGEKLVSRSIRLRHHRLLA